MPESLNIITNTKDIFHIIVLVPAGSIYEDERTRGISHLLEHMMMKHTKKFSELQLLKEGTSIGGTWNAQTDRDVTIYYMLAHMDNYKKCMEVVHSCVREPVFTEHELEIERKVVIEELKRDLDRLTNMYDLAYRTVLSRRNPYLYPIEGYVKTLNAITVSDLRTYMKRRYSECMVFINCKGGHFEEKVKRYAEHLFGKSKTVNFNDPSVMEHIEHAKKASGDVRVIEKPLEQFQIHISFPTYPRSMTKENITIEFIMYCLVGCGLYSILMTELRTKRGLIYGIQAVNETYRYLGVLGIKVSTSLQKTTYIIGLILDELMKICKRGFNPKKLAYYKKSFINSRKYIMTNEVHKSFVFSESLFYGREIDDLDIVEGLSNSDIIDVANAVFDMQVMGILTYGKYKDVEDETKKIITLVHTYKNMHVK